MGSCAFRFWSMPTRVIIDAAGGCWRTSSWARAADVNATMQMATSMVGLVTDIRPSRRLSRRGLRGCAGARREHVLPERDVDRGAHRDVQAPVGGLPVAIHDVLVFGPHAEQVRGRDRKSVV